MNVIDVTGLTKSFNGVRRGRPHRAAVAAGEIVGFLGPNGSGKTTTIRMICGLLTPDAGEGTVLGFDVRRDSARIKREVGYMTQKFSLYEDLTIEENLFFVARLYHLADRRAGRRDDARRARPDNRGARQSGRHAVGRLEAAPGACRLHHAPTETAAARRADRRRRSEGAARVLGRDPPPRRRRAHGAGLDPLHGRGGTLPPHQLHLLWQDARHRHGPRDRARVGPVDLRRRRAVVG